MKFNNYKSLLTALLLTAAVTATLTSLTACSEDETMNEQTDNRTTVAFSPSVQQLSGFAEVTTRSSEVIGTPETGKTAWAEGDELFATVYLDNEKTTVKQVQYCFKIKYNANKTWEVDATNAKVVTVSTNNDNSYNLIDLSSFATYVKSDALVLPVGFEDCTARYQVIYEYAPGQQWTNRGDFYYLNIINPDDIALNEYRNISIGSFITPFTSIGSTVGSQWISQTRFRVAAASGNKIRFTTTGACYPSGGSISSPTDTQVFTATANASGNAFFYVAFDQGQGGTTTTHTLTVENGGNDGSTFEKMFVKTFTDNDVTYFANNASFVIDARLAN